MKFASAISTAESVHHATHELLAELETTFRGEADLVLLFTAQRTAADFAVGRHAALGISQGG